MYVNLGVGLKHERCGSTILKFVVTTAKVKPQRVAVQRVQVVRVFFTCNIKSKNNNNNNCGKRAAKRCNNVENYAKS